MKIFCACLFFTLLAIYSSFFRSISVEAIDVSSQVQVVNTYPPTEIFSFENKIYLGNGSTNGGDAKAVYYNPATNALVTEASLNEEKVERFRVFDGQLYIAGRDSGGGNGTTTMYRKEASGWKGYGRNFGGSQHHWDVYKFNDTLFVNGFPSRWGISISQDDGATWTSPGGTSVETNVSPWEFFDIQGVLYHSSIKHSNSTDPFLIKFDGTTFVPVISNPSSFWPSGFSGTVGYSVKFKDTVVFTNPQGGTPGGTEVFALTSVEPLQIRRLQLPSGSNRKVWDIKARPDAVYVLATSGDENKPWLRTLPDTLRPRVLVYKTTDLQTWEEVFRFQGEDQWVKGIEEVDGDFYISSYRGLLKIDSSVLSPTGTVMTPTPTPTLIPSDTPVPPTSTPVQEPGDVNSDGSVNLTDLSTVLSHFGQTGPRSQGDLNGDGIVSIQDLSEVLQHFGT